MKASPSVYSISDKAFSDELTVAENLQKLRDFGFPRLHFSHAWRRLDPLSEAEVESWQRDLEQTGMRVLDVHGIHSEGTNFWSDPVGERDAAIELFRHRLEVTSALGGDAMVYHVPCHVEPTPEVMARFFDGLERMEEKVRALGVIVALENHYLLENDRQTLSRAFERFDPDYIGFTFDPGHALISGNTDWLLDNCMDRLKVLHLNDNDAENDRHWNPYEAAGQADWDRIAEAVAASPYAKPLQLEVSWKKDKHALHDAFLQDAYAAAERFSRAVESAS